MVFWLATAVSHAHSISKSLVNRLPGSAHGTWATTTPCCLCSMFFRQKRHGVFRLMCSWFSAG